MLKLSKLNLLWALILVLSACQNPSQVGLGPALDLTPPHVAFTSPNNLAYVGDNFSLAGTCSDNVSVVGITITVSPPLPSTAGMAVNFSSGGTTWSANLTKVPDGQYNFTVTAHDAAGNQGSSSVAFLTVTVDGSAPSGVVSAPVLEPLTFLQGLNQVRTLANMAYYQYGTFNVKANLDDTFSISSATLELQDSSNSDVFSQTLTAGQPFPANVTGGSLYSWTMAIDSTKLTGSAANLNPATPVYLSLKLTVVNKSGVTTVYSAANNNSPGYLCVWQNSALPWTSSNQQNAASVAAGNILSGNAFAPAGVAKVYLLIQPSSSPAPSSTAYTSWTTATSGTQVSSVINVTAAPQSTTWSLAAPATPGTYVLYRMTTDVQGRATAAYETLTFTVPNTNAPQTVISSPLDQSITPATGTGTFSITGYSYDVLANGLSQAPASFKVAWVPWGSNPSSPQSTAFLLNNWTGWAGASGTTVYTDTTTGTKVWDFSALLGQSGTYNGTWNASAGSSGAYRWDWTKSFNVENDFTVSGVPEYKEHRLIFCTTDDSGNQSFSSLTLQGPTTPPTLSITSPSNGTLVRSVPGNYFSITGTASDPGLLGSVQVTWINSGGTNLTVTPAISPVWNSATSTWSTNWTVTSDQFSVSGVPQIGTGPQNFQILATDKYGNTTFGALYLQVDNGTPGVLSLTTPTANGDYTVGTNILVSVVFNKAVYVSGTPTLTLNTTPAAVLSYTSGSGSNSLTFSYTVAAGQNSPKLDVASSSALALTGGSITDAALNPANLNLPTPGGSGSLSATKTITIDTTPPVISSISTSTSAGTYDIGSVLFFNVNFSKVVSVAASGLALPLNIQNNGVSRSASYASGSTTSTLVFTYSVAQGDSVASNAPIDVGSALSGTVKDLAGNVANLSLSGLSIASAGLHINTQAKVTNVTTTAAGGNYKEGAVIPIVLSFNRNVTVSGSPTLTLATSSSSTAVYLGGSGSSNLTFDYTVSSNDYAATLNVSSLNLNGGSLSDSAGQPALLALPAAGNPGSLGQNTQLSVDGVALSATTMFNNGSTITNRAANLSASPSHFIETNNASLTLTFANPNGNKVLSKGIGLLTLSPVGTPIPDVLSMYDFAQDCASPALNSTDLANLNASYTLTTNGVSGSSPSSIGVYVLNYNLDPSNSTLGAIFQKLGYYVYVIDVQSSQVAISGNTVTIIPASGLPLGIPFTLTYPAGVFLDQAGHSSPALSGFNFTTSPAATPVVRVNRQTGALLTASPYTTTQPFQVPFKIDDETPGAVLSYGLTTITTTTATTPSLSAPASLASVYSSPVNLGTANDASHGEGDWIRAQASLSGLTNSAFDDEIAYKTVLSTTFTTTTQTKTKDNEAVTSADVSGPTFVWYRGSNNSGGPTTEPGFPLTWQDNQYTGIKLATNVGSNTWVLVSWEMQVPGQYKALWCDMPSDWATMGPYYYSWQNYSNMLLNPGAFNANPGTTYETWASHTRP
jgi:hypothetical protein